MSQGRRWTVADTKGNPIYLTEERWEHICDGHPEMMAYEAAVRETIRNGRRHQDALEPQKYYYQYAVSNLPGRRTHIEAIVLFRGFYDDEEVHTANNYVVTAIPHGDPMKTMTEPRVVYDEPADTLYIAFFPGECATGLSLSDHILIRVNAEERRANGITLLDFSSWRNGLKSVRAAFLWLASVTYLLTFKNSHSNSSVRSRLATISALWQIRRGGFPA